MSSAPLQPATPVFPFPDMPYPTAPAWSFGFAEWSMLLTLLLCGMHAVRKGRPGALSYLFGGFLFGLLLEYVEVLSNSYRYGHFHLMLGRAPLDIPICIGAGWGIILYTSRLSSDALGLPLAAAAALDTLLALNIDLSMDVVAYRLHMWHWDWTGTSLNPLRAQWFGVPYGNFVGWATVVFCYSAFSRLWARRLAPLQIMPTATSRMPDSIPVLSSTIAGRFIAVTVLSLVCSQGVLFSLEACVWAFLRRHLGLTSGVRLLLIITAMLALVAMGWRKRVRTADRVPPLAVLVPCWFHSYFLFCFLWFHFFRENTWMSLAALTNLVVGVFIHLVPARRYRRDVRARPERLEGAPGKRVVVHLS